MGSDGSRVARSSCVESEHLGQGGFNPVKTEGKGKVRASACMRWDTWLAERKLRGTAQGGRTTPPPARLNTIFRALKRTESAMEEETR